MEGLEVGGEGVVVGRVGDNEGEGGRRGVRDNGGKMRFQCRGGFRDGSPIVARACAFCRRNDSSPRTSIREMQLHHAPGKREMVCCANGGSRWKIWSIGKRI